ncbi:hypothetical protein GME_15465 [Halomonas sp. TD01]|nr:hypothetical protein GME_15465 [Halomonas sp. TD01]
MMMLNVARKLMDETPLPDPGPGKSLPDSLQAGE